MIEDLMVIIIINLEINLQSILIILNFLIERMQVLNRREISKRDKYF